MFNSLSDLWPKLSWNLAISDYMALFVFTPNTSDMTGGIVLTAFVYGQTYRLEFLACRSSERISRS